MRKLDNETFISFVVGLFHRLMSRVVQLVGSEAKLFYRQISFPVARNHWVIVDMKPHPDAVMKVWSYYFHIYTFGIVYFMIVTFF